MRTDSKPWMLLILVGLGCSLLLAASGEELFQRALRKERAEGDLPGAIEIYEQIVRENESERALVARSLVQLGRGYEKLGSTRAAEAYRRVVQDFSDQRGQADEARRRLATLEKNTAGAPQGGIVARRVDELDAMGQPSPDGRTLSFVNWKQGGNLGVYEIATGAKRDVTRDATWDGAGAFGDKSIWSPDGTQIAYFWFHGNRGELRVVAADGGEPRVLVPFGTDGTAYPQAFTADGKQIQALHNRVNESGVHQGHGMVLVDVATGQMRTIRDLPDEPHSCVMSISPDGRWIAYVDAGPGGDQDIHVTTLDGATDRILVGHPAEDHDPLWTPDGRYVVFVSDRAGDRALWAVEVVDGRAAGDATLVKNDLGSGFILMGFSNDGTLYYTVQQPRHNVYTANVDFDSGTIDGSQLVSTRFDGVNGIPFWSPDGSQLAYLSRRGKRIAVVIRDMETGDERDLEPDLERIELPVGWAWPRWSPDGRHLLLKGQPPTAPTASIRLVDVKTGADSELIAADRTFKSFTPDGSAVIYAVDRGTESAPRIDIMVRDVSTGGERIVRSTSAYAYRFAVDPSGASVAYFEGDSRSADDDTGSAAAWQSRLMITALGDGATRQVGSPGKGSSYSWGPGLAWLPGGGRLLLATEDAEHDVQLRVVDVASGAMKSIGPVYSLEERPQHVQVHPDGKRIAYGKGSIKGEVWRIENLFASR